MPFDTTPNLPGNPLVTVKFSGLMVLQPGDNKTCKVGVHKFNRTHLFQAILVISKPGQAPILITLFTGPLQDNFSIRLDPDPNPAQGDFKVLQKGNFDPTTLANPNPAGADNNANDYRWAINLQAPAGGIAINEGGAPSVILKTGVL